MHVNRCERGAVYGGLPEAGRGSDPGEVEVREFVKGGFVLVANGGSTGCVPGVDAADELANHGGIEQGLEGLEAGGEIGDGLGTVG